MTMRTKHHATIYAIAAAALYAVNVPFSKGVVEPTMMAAFLYLGAGLGMFVFSACLCWGIENNCTRMISNKSSVEIVVIKGIFSGLGSLTVALVMGEKMPSVLWGLCVMLLGFVAYGLSIYFYVMAQKDLGAVCIIGGAMISELVKPGKRKAPTEAQI